MADLADYSGKFNPDLRLEDFSKGVLARWAAEFGRQYLLISGLWFNYFRTKFGTTLADQTHWEVWEILHEVHEEDRVKYALNMWGTDLEACMKWFTMDPALLDFDVKCEVLGPGHGRVTVRNCSALRYMEKHDDWDLLENGCGLDVWGFPRALRRICPDAHVVCTQCPPRKSKDEPSCVWDVTLDPTHSKSLVDPNVPEYAQEAQKKAGQLWGRRVRYPYRYLLGKK